MSRIKILRELSKAAIKRNMSTTAIPSSEPFNSKGMNLARGVTTEKSTILPRDLPKPPRMEDKLGNTVSRANHLQTNAKPPLASSPLPTGIKPPLHQLLEQYSSNILKPDIDMSSEEEHLDNLNSWKHLIEYLAEKKGNTKAFIQETVEKIGQAEPHTKDFTAPKDIIDEVLNKIRSHSASFPTLLATNFAEPLIRAGAAPVANVLFSMFADKTGKVPKEKAGKLMRYMAYITTAMLVATAYKIYTDEVKKIETLDKEVAGAIEVLEEHLQDYVLSIRKIEKLVEENVQLEAQQEHYKELIEVLDQADRQSPDSNYTSMIFLARAYLYSAMSSKTMEQAIQELSIRDELLRRSQNEGDKLAEELLELETLSGYQSVRTKLVHKQEKLNEKHEKVSQNLDDKLEKMQTFAEKLRQGKENIENKGKQIKEHYFVRVGIIKEVAQNPEKIDGMQQKEQTLTSRYKDTTQKIRHENNEKLPEDDFDGTLSLNPSC